MSHSGSHPPSTHVLILPITRCYSCLSPKVAGRYGLSFRYCLHAIRNSHISISISLPRKLMEREIQEHWGLDKLKKFVRKIIDLDIGSKKLGQKLSKKLKKTEKKWKKISKFFEQTTADSSYLLEKSLEFFPIFSKTSRPSIFDPMLRSIFFFHQFFSTFRIPNVPESLS